MRNFKRISAVILVIAMMLSLVSINSFAADEYSVSYKIRKTADSTEDITSKGIKAGKDIYIDIIVSPTGEYPFLNLKYTTLYQLTASDIDVKASGYNKNGLAPANQGVMSLMFTSGTEIAEDGVVATVKMTIPSDTTPNTNVNLLTLDDSAYTDPNGDNHKFTAVNATIPIVDGFTATKASVEALTEEIGLGTTKEQVIAKFGKATVANEDGSKTEGGFNVVEWNSADYDADKAGTYTFTGKVNPPASDDGLASFDAALTVTTTVTVGNIPLTADMVSAFETYGVPQKDDTTMTAAEVAALVNAEEAYTKATISNNGKYTENVTVAWTGADGTLDLAKVTEDEPTNKVTLKGAVTLGTTTNYTQDTAVELSLDVIVVPATIEGGNIKLGSVNESQNLDVTVSFPSGGKSKNGKTVVATIYNSLGEAVATFDYELNDDKDLKDGVYTVKMTFAKSMDACGINTGDSFAVGVACDGAAILSGDKETVEDTVAPRGGGSSSVSGGNSNNPVVNTKSYKIETTESENGTFTVSPVTAKSGETVTVTTSPAEGFKTDVITVVSKSGADVEVNQAARTFVMPANDVTVSVTFVEGEEVPPVVVNNGPFEDVPSDHWAAEFIETLKNAGVITGVTDTTFAPDTNVTRAEYAKMVTGIFGIAPSQNASVFEDCTEDDWFTPYVVAATEAGYILGVSDTEFAPNAEITREQAFTILGRALGQTAQGEADMAFTDAASISDYAEPYVRLLVELGVVGGDENGAIRPADPISRAESAKIIAVVYGILNPAADVDNTEIENGEEANAEVENAEDVNAEDENAEEGAEEGVEEGVEDGAEDVAADDAGAEDAGAADAE